MGIHKIPGTGFTWNYCHGLPALIGVIVFVGVVLGLWQFVYRGEVMSYGITKDSVRFKPTTATEGDTIELCFDDIVWKRLCPSHLVTNLTPAKGPRLDLTPYPINTPFHVDAKDLPHRVTPKCRKWVVPDLGPDRSAGLAVLSGFGESYCSPLDYWRPIITPLPSAKITINKRGQ